MAEFIKRQSGGGRSVLAITDIPGGEDLTRWPALCEFLAVNDWGGGKRRDPGTLTLCFGDGRWKGCLNDRDAHQTCWVSAGALLAVLDVLDAGLRDASLEWRQDRRPGQARR